MRPLPTAACLAPLFLTACGGGGGGGAVPPATTELRLRLDGTTIGSGQSDGTVTLRIDALPAGVRPALLEADFVFDPARLRPSTARAPLQALQGEPTLDGQLHGDSYHVICGDAQHAAAALLAAGPMLSLALEPMAPRAPGDVAVELRNLRVVDQDGAPLTAAGGPIVAHVTVQ
jgi:hypothetical protein